MKLRALFWIAGYFALVFIVARIIHFDNDREDKIALREQLRLARAEGIPTTAAEFAATIPTAKPDENAALLYRELPKSNFYPPAALYARMMSDPDPKTAEEAKIFLEGKVSILRIVDLAVTKPKCWFNRDWSTGYALLFSEYFPMKESAKLLILRGSVAAANGHPDAATADARRALLVAKHAGSEPLLISRLVRQSIVSTAFRADASWCMMHRNEPRYREFLGEAIAAIGPEPDLRKEASRDLYAERLIYERAGTERGLRDLGLQPDEMKPTPEETAYSERHSAGKSQADLVRAFRERWKALALTGNAQLDGLGQAWEDYVDALFVYPVAANTILELSMPPRDPLAYQQEYWEAWRCDLVAIQRALLQEKIPTSIDTSDLKSPFDGTPLKYGFDGKQIVVEISKAGVDDDGKFLTLKVPPGP